MLSSTSWIGLLHCSEMLRSTPIIRSDFVCSAVRKRQGWIGATVYLTAGGNRLRGDVLSGGSFSSSNDLRPHFGLGSAARVDNCEIRWPSGRVKVVLPAVNRIFTVEEGKGIIDSANDRPTK